MRLVRHDFDTAAAGFRHTTEIDPHWTWGYIKLGRTLALQGKCQDAFVQAEIAERRIAGGVGALSRAWLGSTYATCGDVTRAREKLGELHGFEAKRYVDPATFADIHASLGEIDQAVNWYRKALADRSPDMVYAQLAGRINAKLAASADYRAILAQMAFPP